MRMPMTGHNAPNGSATTFENYLMYLYNYYKCASVGHVFNTNIFSQHSCINLYQYDQGTMISCRKKCLPLPLPLQKRLIPAQEKNESQEKNSRLFLYVVPRQQPLYTFRHFNAQVFYTEPLPITRYEWLSCEMNVSIPFTVQTTFAFQCKETTRREGTAGQNMANTLVACAADETKPRYSPSANQRP